MDTDDSSRGSSASNTTSNSSANSRQSSPVPGNEIDNVKTITGFSVTSPGSSVGENSRHRSVSTNEGTPRSPIKSDSSSSSSSSSSSDAENDDAKSNNSVVHVKSKRSSERSSCSSAGSPIKLNVAESSAPLQSLTNSINSKSSSNRSRSNSSDNISVDRNINIVHDDLSDVSDNESEKHNSLTKLDTESIAAETTQDELLSIPNNIADKKELSITDLRYKLDKTDKKLKPSDVLTDNITTNETGTLNGNGNGNGHDVVVSIEDLVKTHDEDALDFEAEEGECPDVCKDDESAPMEKVKEDNKPNDKVNSEKSDIVEIEEGEELEEGEVSDEDEKRPEETEPKPVCRFYTRGQCTWGMSCRFLHPGVTDKGNYTMFDLVRPVSVPQTSTTAPRASNFSHGSEYLEYRTERPSAIPRTTVHHTTAAYSALHDTRALIPEGAVVLESAWERGLRTAKEMMRKANKRKEQDMDFEDKKMNLTLSPDELEKEPYFLKERVSPPDILQPVSPYVRHGGYQEAPTGIYSPPDRYARGPPLNTFDEVDPYGRTARYRELPAHRMPQYEDERRVRPTREVIVQRVEPVGRGDEWNDPWMRSKSPGAHGSPRDRSEKRRRGRRSYSSNSSYSSSSSSQSDSSSDSSRSPSPSDRKRRYNSSANKASPSSRRHAVRSARSQSLLKRHSRQSPSIRNSPNVKRTTVFSPTHKRKADSPIKKKSTSDKSKLKRRHTSSSSESGSSDTSASDSDSDSASTSSGSSSGSKKRISLKRARGVLEKGASDRKVLKKVEPTVKKRSPISIEIKKPATVGASALVTSPTHSVNSEKDSKKSRREELLKQLRAVEDAIAKKRSKLA